MVLCGIVCAVAMCLWLFCKKKLSEDIRKMLLVLSAMAGLGVVAGMADEPGGTLQGEVQLVRNAAGEGSYEEELQLDAEELLEKYDYTVTVPARVLTAEEEKQTLEQAKQEIDGEFLGENASFQDVQKKVVIQETYQKGLVEARWEFDAPEIVDYDGEIRTDNLPEEGKLVQASVELTCGKTSCCYEFLFCVMPLQRNEQEQLLKDLNDYLSEQTTQAGEDTVVLPETLGNRKLCWSKKEEHLSEKLLAMGVLLAVAIPILTLSKRQEQQKKREEQLVMEYPDMISKLVLLMGAGMTLRGAWKKIAFEYEGKRKKNLISQRISYEEMLRTCHEIEGGIGEGQAYERFGERCGVARYRKLGNTLSQNLRKGNYGLLELLESEVEEAFEERKSMAKKYGEEAGTKLLFPMIMMLGMILVLLLVPAMLAFQM